MGGCKGVRMKRKDIRKILKKWVYREKTGYHHIWYTFVDIDIGGEKMSSQFESLVDEVYKMVQEKSNVV
jgi:hypothetical protein